MSEELSPDVSVIIPVYNVQKYIARCVHSLFNQTLSAIQYIFIDDHTPDNSISILEEIIEQYPQRRGQVTILKNSENLGVGASRQKGMEAASGKYIIHCDPDDWVEPDMYERLYNEAESNDSDMVICDFTRVIGESETIDKQSIIPLTSNSLLQAISGQSIQKIHGGLCNKLIKMSQCSHIEFFKGIDYCEDALFLWQLLQKNIKISHIDYAGYHYVINPNSITCTYNPSNISTEEKLIRAIMQVSEHSSHQNIKYCRNAFIASILYNRILRYKGLSNNEFKTKFQWLKFVIGYNTQIGIIGNLLLRIAFNINFDSAQTIFGSLRKVKNALHRTNYPIK